MLSPRWLRTIGAWVLLTIGPSTFVLAQEAAASQSATAPAEPTPVTARVLEVHGDVKHAPLDATEWQACQVDEEYPAQTMIQTGLRSSLKLQIGADDTYTAVVIESASRVVLSELHQTTDVKHVRIGVGYGRMRAGVAEGGLKSDFTVDSPVATLSKRGTWDFGLFYERGTDRFEIFLLDHGLVDALSKVTRERRAVLPQQIVTQTMRRWLDEAQVRRNVAVPDMLGQGDVDVAFNTLQQSGLRVVNPEGGQTVLVDLSNSTAAQNFADIARNSLNTAPPLTPARPRPQEPVTRPEGFFGTGRGDELIPVIIKANSPLAQKGFAQPGTYRFRRAALEGWLKQQGRK